MMNDKAMKVARLIVEAHINSWGMVPHPDFLKESIAASLREAASGKLEKMGDIDVPARP